MGKSESPRRAVVSMVKNEADVIEPWLAHMAALFDRVVIADHNSHDGTREFLEAAAASDPDRVKLVRFANAEYEQRRLINFLAHDLIDQEPEIEWVTSLDADEFLPFKTHDELSTFLADNGGRDHFLLGWKNCAPLERGGPDPWSGPWIIPPEINHHGKVFLRSKLLADGRFELVQGNHALKDTRRQHSHHPERLGHLYHLPLRSEEQFRLKILQGVLAYSRQGRRRDPRLGVHWFELFHRLLDSKLTDADFNAIALTYGDPEQPEDSAAYDTSRLLANGHISEPLEGIGIPGRKASVRQQSMAEVTLRVLGELEREGLIGGKQMNDLIERWELEEVEGAVGDRLRADHMQFKTLAPVTVDASEEDRGLDLDQRLQEYAGWRIESLVPTSWGEHIPFMFGLIGVLRPRVYVDLGTHYGASFFAACQALKRLGIDGTAVAIDNWRGDINTGAYDESVFERFQYILRSRYSGIGRYLRMDFDKAASHFEEGSVDLIQIDGLHTYEAVKNDFETWRPKMTEDGIMLFHDIGVHKQDFGVWKLWEELKRDFPTFEFNHCHGLGVLFLGDIEGDSTAAALMRHFRDDASAERIRHFYATIGELSVNRQLLEYQNKELEDRLEARVPGAGDQRPLPRDAERLRNELAAVYNSTSWRVTAPIRWVIQVLRGGRG